jgi:hypothetical protein
MAFLPRTFHRKLINDYIIVELNAIRMRERQMCTVVQLTYLCINIKPA